MATCQHFPLDLLAELSEPSFEAFGWTGLEEATSPEPAAEGLDRYIEKAMKGAGERSSTNDGFSDYLASCFGSAEPAVEASGWTGLERPSDKVSSPVPTAEGLDRYIEQALEGAGERSSSNDGFSDYLASCFGSPEPAVEGDGEAPLEKRPSPYIYIAPSNPPVPVPSSPPAPAPFSQPAPVTLTIKVSPQGYESFLCNISVPKPVPAKRGRPKSASPKRRRSSGHISPQVYLKRLNARIKKEEKEKENEKIKRLAQRLESMI